MADRIGPCLRQAFSNGRFGGLPRVLVRRNNKLHAVIPLFMSIRCNTCGDYFSEGTKFSCWMEEFVGETYSGLNGTRFYYKCPKCSVEITIKCYDHDPKWVVESGATTVADNEKRRSEAEELGDVMNPLQHRTHSPPTLMKPNRSRCNARGICCRSLSCFPFKSALFFPNIVTTEIRGFCPWDQR